MPEWIDRLPLGPDFLSNTVFSMWGFEPTDHFPLDYIEQLSYTALWIMWFPKENSRKKCKSSKLRQHMTWLCSWQSVGLYTKPHMNIWVPAMEIKWKKKERKRIDGGREKKTCRVDFAPGEDQAHHISIDRLALKSQCLIPSRPLDRMPACFLTAERHSSAAPKGFPLPQMITELMRIHIF